MHTLGFAVVALTILVVACDQPEDDNSHGLPDLSDYPEFFTPNEDYYVTRISSVPDLIPGEYRLNISGAVDEPASLTLSELYDLEMVTIPLTVECIGNPQSGRLLSTAEWTGFDLYALLQSMGLSSNAVAVQYRCADGYYASHTIGQLEDLQILGALFMNGDTLPALQGFPLRIIIPGYYGVKQPAWVTDIEVLVTSGDDFWNHYNWDTSPAMPPDCKISFPDDHSSYAPGDTIRLGGPAYGSGRITGVEYSLNGGEDWRVAEIIQSIDADNVWVFWQAILMLSEEGSYTIHVRARDQDGNTQPGEDLYTLDGSNATPLIHISMES